MSLHASVETLRPWWVYKLLWIPFLKLLVGLFAKKVSGHLEPERQDKPDALPLASSTYETLSGLRWDFPVSPRLLQEGHVAPLQVEFRCEVVSLPCCR